MANDGGEDHDDLKRVVDVGPEDAKRDTKRVGDSLGVARGSERVLPFADGAFRHARGTGEGRLLKPGLLSPVEEPLGKRSVASDPALPVGRRYDSLCTHSENVYRYSVNKSSVVGSRSTTPEISTDSMAKAQLWVATPEWKKAARDAIDARGRGGAERLAEAVGCDASMLTKLCRYPARQGDTWVSALIGPISVELDIFMPVAVTNKVEQEVLEKVQGMTDEQVRRFMMAWELMVPPPKKK